MNLKPLGENTWCVGKSCYATYNVQSNIGNCSFYWRYLYQIALTNYCLQRKITYAVKIMWVRYVSVTMLSELDQSYKWFLKFDELLCSRFEIYDSWFESLAYLCILILLFLPCLYITSHWLKGFSLYLLFLLLCSDELLSIQTNSSPVEWTSIILKPLVFL